MNLLMISGDRALASGKRGAFYATLEELSKHFKRIDVLCPRSKVSQEQTLFGNVYVHPSPRGLWYQSLWILKKGKELSQQHQYNVMTVHDYPPFYNGCGVWLLQRATGIPWVSEIHHVVGHPFAANVREWIGRKMYPLYFRTIGRKAAAFRVVNSGTRELLVKSGVLRECVHLIPSFYLDHGLLRPDPSIQKKYDVVFCGRLVANKGVEELLEAARYVTLGMRLLIIGDGPLLLHLEAKSYHLKADVTFTGWLPSLQDVYRSMQSAKVFGMCSKSEGGPRVVLEAMALGLPVIATNVGVVPDVIRDGENGLITTGTPQDLAEKIQELLSDDPCRMRMGTEAKKVLGRFEKRSLIIQYADFLKSFA